jgi:flagellar protein FlaG
MLSSISDKAPAAAGGAPTPVPENHVSAPAPAREADRAAPAAAEPSRSELESAVKTLNKFTEMAAQDVQFSIDDESGKTVVKVIDVETQTVLRQFPNAEALSISRSLDKMQGLLLRDKA